MDAFEILIKDHELVAGLFEQLEASDSAENQRSLFTQIKQELDIHAIAEETILYPRLKEAAETRDIAFEAVEEHQEIKNFLAQLEIMSPADDSWSDTIADLKATVEHHVDEEENEMFEQARQIFSQEEIDEIGEQITLKKRNQLKTATTKS